MGLIARGSLSLDFPHPLGHWIGYGANAPPLPIRNVLLDGKPVPGARVYLKNSRILSWAYAMPTLCWLRWGKQITGKVEGRTRSEARNALKKILGVDSLPPGVQLQEINVS